MNHAHWHIEFESDPEFESVGVVAIVDEDDGAMSVTNDAEYVVEAVAARVKLAGRRLIYRDTTGRWDELLHKDGKFTGFAYVGGATLAQALAIVNARRVA